MDIKSLFNQNRRSKTKEYNKKKKFNNRVRLTLNIVFWIVFLGFSLEIKIFTYINTIISNNEIRIFIYLFFFYLLYNLFTLFLDYFLSYKLSREFNLSNQNKNEWLIDELKSFVLSLIFFYFAVRSYLYLIHISPDLWWLYYTILASLFIVLITFIFPTVLLPIFFKLESYPDSELKGRLLGLIQKANLEIDDIYEINLSSKINAANAAVMGLGSSRKVVLGDNLKEKYNYDEIEAVLAHELGHQVHGDIFRNILVQPFILLFISYIVFNTWPYISNWYGYNSYLDVYTIPLLLILVSLLSWTFSPIQLVMSRLAEKKADLYAITLTGKGRALANGLAKLADESLSPLEVSLYKKVFKLSHPPIRERLKYILDNS